MSCVGLPGWKVLVQCGVAEDACGLYSFELWYLVSGGVICPGVAVGSPLYPGW